MGANASHTDVYVTSSQKSPNFQSEQRPGDKQPPEDALQQLLEAEDFLEQVFQRLSGDGLHVCRRVCRHWDAVARRMPHRLESIDPSALSDVAAKFLNAVSLKTRLVEVDKSIDPVMKGLAKFKRLERLVLDVEFEAAVKIRWRPFFRSMERLTALDIAWPLGDWSAAFYDGLRRLTSLTSLTLYTCGVAHPKTRPLTELARLQRLEVNSALLVNDKGVIFFQRLHLLTHLKFQRGFLESDPSRTLHCLKALKYYKATLKSLECDLNESRFIYNPEAGQQSNPPAVDFSESWSQLTQLRHLNKLTLLSVCNLTPQHFSNLANLLDLTELEIGTGWKANSEDAISLQSLEAICTLTGLKSLTLCNISSSTIVFNSCSSLLFLTKLVVKRGNFGTSLGQLRQLEHLQIEKLWQSSKALLETLSCLKSLRVLVLKEQNHFCLPSDTLALLSQLQRLELDAVLFDERFFKCLATFPDLHHLTLRSRPVHPYLDEFLVQINDLRHLRSLRFDCKGRLSAASYLQHGKLPRLTDLEVSNFTEEERLELFKKFPLRTLKFRDM